MIRILLAVAALLAVGTAAAHAVSTERFTLLVGNQGAGGDPGVLYAGGPANFTVHDRTGAQRPFELCITPAPIDQPSCMRGTTGRVISGPAFSQAGETVARVTVEGSPSFERTLTVVAGEAARDERPHRILGASATFGGGGAAVVLRLDHALPRPGQQRPPFMLGRALLRNEILPRGQRFYGGLTPMRVGRRDRHCYSAEAQQIVPRSALRAGAVFTAALRRHRRIVATKPVVLRAGGDGFDRALLRRAGC